MPKIVRITSTVDGFRRAGMSHPASTEEYPADWFDREELAALQAEPKLIVQVLDLPDIPDPLELEGSGAPRAATPDAAKEPAGDPAGQGAPGDIPPAPEAPDAGKDAKPAKGKAEGK